MFRHSFPEVCRLSSISGTTMIYNKIQKSHFFFHGPFLHFHLASTLPSALSLAKQLSPRHWSSATNRRPLLGIVRSVPSWRTSNVRCKSRRCHSTCWTQTTTCFCHSVDNVSGILKNTAINVNSYLCLPVRRSFSWLSQGAVVKSWRNYLWKVLYLTCIM